MRTKVKAFILQKDLCVAKGKAQANSNFTFKDDDGNTIWKDPHTYSGGGTQFYVEKAERKNFKEGKVRKI